MDRSSEMLGKNMQDIRPMGNYRFCLIIEKGQASDDKDIRIGFSSVSSFGYSVEVEEIAVGGINDRKVVLPKSVKASNVSCSRGVADDDGIYKWINEIREGKYIKRNMLLMAVGGGLKKIWSFEDVLPIKWEISGFDAISHAIVIENLELNVESIKEISV